MAKKIRHEDIFQGDIFKPTRDAAVELLKVTEQLKKGLIETGKDIKKAFAGIKIEGSADLKKFSKLTEESAKVQKAKNQVDKEEEKIKKKIKTLTDAEVKAKILSAKATKEQKDRVDALIIIQDKQAGTLQKLAARNKLLRQTREKLNLTTEKGRKALIKINKKLDENNKEILKNSDALKKQRLNVGNYTEGVKDAISQTGVFGSITSKLTAIQNVLNAVLGKNAAAAKADVAIKKKQTVATTQLTIAQKASAVATGIGTKALRVFKFALASTGIGLLVIALGSLISFFSRSQKGIDFLRVKMAGLRAAVDVIIDSFSEFGEVIFDALSNPKKLLTDLVDFIKKIPGLVLDNIINRFKAIGIIIRAIGDRDLTALRDGLLQLGTGIEDFSEKAGNALDKLVGKSQEAIDKVKQLAAELAEKTRIAQILERLTIKLNREEALFSAQQSALITKTRQLNLISRDKLKSDQVRIDALKEANIIEVSIAEQLLVLEEKSLAASLDSLSANEQTLSLDKDRLKFINDIKNGTISTADAIQKSADFTLSSAEGEEAFREIIGKIVTLEQARQNLLDKQATTVKKLSALQVVVATKNSTAQLALAANQREIFNDEDEQIDKRIEAIEKARDFDIAGNKFRLDANIINETEFQARKLLVTKKTEKAIQKLLEKNAPKDKTQEKLDEVDRLQAISEAKIQQQISDFDDEKKFEKFKQKEILKIQIEAIKRRLEIIRGLQGTEFQLQREQLKAQLATLNKTFDESGEKTVESTKTTADDIANIFEDAFNKANERRRKTIDDELKLREGSIAVQQALAERGLDNTLAFEKQRQAQAELERKKQEQREIRRQKVISFFRLFSELAKTDPNTAAQKALAQVLIADVISGAFAEGVEKLNGKGTKTSDSNLALLSKDESVITADGTNENRGLATAMNTGKVDEYFAKNFLPKYLSEGTFLTKSTAANMNNSAMLHQLVGVNEKLERLEKVVAGKKETSINLDNLGNVITSDFENGFRKTVTFMRRKPRL